MAAPSSAAPALAGEGAGKRALVTGLQGFTGRYMARELAAAGYQVFGTGLSGDEAGTNIWHVDLTDRSAMADMVQEARPDVVVHLAGIAFVAHANPDLIYRVNISGTRNLLEALAGLHKKPSAVLLASSANIYGNTDIALIDENVAPAPSNDYAVSKLAMEHMARLWSERLPIIIARPFNYTGVGQNEDFLLPKIVAHFRSHAPEIELGNLAVARDFSDVRVIAASYRRLLAAAPCGEAFNVCSGRAYSLDNVLDLMAGIAGYRIAVRVNPAFLRSHEVARLVGSSAKLHGVIGPIDASPLEQTLRWMYQS